MNRDYYNALAKDVLLAFVSSQRNYTPPENAHMLVESAMAITDEFRKALMRRQMDIDSTELEADEIAALQNNKKIEAIKLVRLRTGLNLKEAKKIVDREQERLGL